MHKTVSIIVPAYNEAEYIEETIKSIKLLADVGEIIVVDDGSKDDTYEILKKIEGIIVIRNPQNKGKGYAIKKGLEKATKEYIALIDADLGKSAVEFGQVLQEMQDDRQKMVIAALPPAVKKGGFGLVKYTSMKGLYMLTSKHCKSVLSGQRVMPLNFIKELELPDCFSLEFVLTLEALKRNLDIVEVPVNIRHRETGRDLAGFIHRGKQFKSITKAILKEVFK